MGIESAEFLVQQEVLTIFSKQIQPYIMEWCTLVDQNDNVIGKEEKLKTHQEGLLHRAFSVFIFNDSNEMLLQKRAASKYHSPSLWTNACCSHPQPDETVLEAGERRLMEEMGFSTELKTIFSFLYKADVGNGLIEHELDHVMAGRYNAHGNYNLAEVSDARFIAFDDLKVEMEQDPDKFTMWFKILVSQHSDKLLAALNEI